MCGETLQEVTVGGSAHRWTEKTDGVKVEKANQVEGFHQIVNSLRRDCPSGADNAMSRKSRTRKYY